MENNFVKLYKTGEWEVLLFKPNGFIKHLILALSLHRCIELEKTS